VTQEDLVTTRQPLAIAQGVAEPVERSADHPRPGRTYSVVGDERIHGRVFASDSAVSPMPRRKATPRGSSRAGRGVVVSAGQGDQAPSWHRVVHRRQSWSVENRRVISSAHRPCETFS